MSVPHYLWRGVCRGPWGNCAQEIRVIHLRLNVCVFEHVCPFEACLSVFSACMCKHLNQRVNKCGYCQCHGCVLGVSVHTGVHEDEWPAGSDFSLLVVFRASEEHTGIIIIIHSLSPLFTVRVEHRSAF